MNKLLIMDRRTVRNMKVSWHNIFGNLVHLFGFIIKKEKRNQMMSRWVGHVALKKAQRNVVRKPK